MNLLHIDNSTASRIHEHLPSSEVLDNLAYFYSIFCDSTRLKILISLTISEMCVNDLCLSLGINQTTISHQLKILRSAGIVTTTRKNKYVFYRITNKFINSIMLSGVNNLLEKVS